MAFDEGLAERLREVFRGKRGVIEKRMFGGVAFMVRGYMAVGIVGDALMARVGPDEYDQLLQMEHVRPMDFTGRPMKNIVYVDPPGLVADEALRKWVRQAVAFTSSLPAKD